MEDVWGLAEILSYSALMEGYPPRIAEIIGLADQDTVSYQLRR